MKSAHQLSIATLIMAGFIATGCSQQQIAGGGSQQVAGGSQVAGSSQAAGSSQQMASQSQVQTAVVTPTPKPKTIIKYKTKTVIKYKEVCRAKCTTPAVKPVGAGHSHPANRCTKTIRHNHKFNSARHTHRYSCKGNTRRNYGAGHNHRAVPGCTNSFRHNHKFNSARHSHKYGCRSSVRRPVQRAVSGNRWTHGHPANRCTKSVRHTHKYKNSRHTHRYSCSGNRRVVKPAVRVQSGHAHRAIPGCTDSYRHNHRMNDKNHSHQYSCKKTQVNVPKMRPKAPVDVYALQRKLKAKGYYRGAIDGIVGSGTRGALQRFMQNRR